MKYFFDKWNDFARLLKDKKHISITHSFQFSAIIVSKTDVGIDIENNLKNVNRWMVSKNRDDSIVTLLKEILPEEEIKPLDKIPIITRISLIHPDYFKYFVYIMIIFIILILEPDFAEKILEQIFK